VKQKYLKLINLAQLIRGNHFQLLL